MENGEKQNEMENDARAKHVSENTWVISLSILMKNHVNPRNRANIREPKIIVARLNRHPMKIKLNENVIDIVTLSNAYA